MMSRVNFARVSGVILDVCRSHGAWFDSGELEEVRRFVVGLGSSATCDGGRSMRLSGVPGRRPVGRHRAPVGPASGPTSSMFSPGSRIAGMFPGRALRPRNSSARSSSRVSVVCSCGGGSAEAGSGGGAGAAPARRSPWRSCCSRPSGRWPTPSTTGGRDARTRPSSHPRAGRARLDRPFGQMRAAATRFCPTAVRLTT